MLAGFLAHRPAEDVPPCNSCILIRGLCSGCIVFNAGILIHAYSVTGSCVKTMECFFCALTLFRLAELQRSRSDPVSFFLLLGFCARCLALWQYYVQIPCRSATELAASLAQRPTAIACFDISASSRVINLPNADTTLRLDSTPHRRFGSICVVHRICVQLVRGELSLNHHKYLQDCFFSMQRALQKQILLKFPNHGGSKDSSVQFCIFAHRAHSSTHWFHPGSGKVTYNPDILTRR